MNRISTSLVAASMVIACGDDSASDGASDASMSAPQDASFGSSPMDAATPSDTFHRICAYRTDSVMDTACGFADAPAGGWGHAPISTCLGSAKTCTTEPFSFTLRIEAGFAKPLKVELVSCPVNVRLDNGASCVPQPNQGKGAPMEMTVKFDAPNFALGPITTITAQQIGTSEIGPPFCDVSSRSGASHIHVSDEYGNQVYIPFSETGSTIGFGC